MESISKIIVSFFISIIFTSNALASDFDFRKSNWGMTKSEVIASEALEVNHDKDGVLGYKTQILSKDVFVVYIFADKKLVRSKYVLAERHSNKNDFITDYKDFMKILTKKYGPPSEEKTIWKNDLYKDDREHYGRAVSTGDLVYFSEWETDDTTIFNVISGDNYKIKCQIEYSSKILKNIEKKAKEQEALDVF